MFCRCPVEPHAAPILDARAFIAGLGVRDLLARVARYAIAGSLLNLSNSDIRHRIRLHIAVRNRCPVMQYRKKLAEWLM